MKICHSVFSISRLGAGLTGFVLPLSLNLAKINHVIEILSLEDKYSSFDMLQWLPLKPILLKNRIRLFAYSEGYSKNLDAISPSIIHQHGLWLYPSFATFKWCQRKGIPWVISPHGMLETWSWNHNNWKKRPCWYLWERFNLQSAAAIHVTSEQEMYSVRRMGITTPIAIIPIGIDLPNISNAIVYNNKGKKYSALFLSRIHPKKGIENLIEAWQIINNNEWQLIIAGPGDPLYVNKLKQKVLNLGLENSIRFKDAVYGVEKDELFSKSDLFVLPSFSENFGIVIAEALAFEIPVITTKATPWQGLINENCGWWIDLGIDSLANTLLEAMQLSGEQRLFMGKRGRKYVEREFNWLESANKMKVLYEWVVHQNNKPDFLFFSPENKM